MNLRQKLYIKLFLFFSFFDRDVGLSTYILHITPLSIHSHTNLIGCILLLFCPSPPARVGTSHLWWFFLVSKLACLRNLFLSAFSSCKFLFHRWWGAFLVFCHLIGSSSSGLLWASSWRAFLNKFRVKQNKALVNNLKRRSHAIVVIFKFFKNFLCASFRQLNQKWFRWFNIVCGNKQMWVVTWNLNDIIALTKLFTALVEYNTILIHIFSLTNNGSSTLCASFAAHTSCTRSATKRTHRLRSKSIARHRRTWTHFALVDNTASHILRNRVIFALGLLISCIGCSHQISGTCLSLSARKLIRELNQVVSVGLCFYILIVPLVYRVSWLLVLQAAQDSLIFYCDSCQLFLTFFSVEGDHFVTFRVVEFRAVILHNVAHFFKKNTIFTLDLRILALSSRFSLRFAHCWNWGKRWSASFTHCWFYRSQSFAVNALVFLSPAAL